MINRAVKALDEAAAEEGAEDDDSSDTSPAPLTVCKVRAVLEEVAEEWPDCGDMSEHQLEMVPRSHLQLLWLLGACRDPETGVPLIAPDGHLICAWRDAVRRRLGDPGGRNRIEVVGNPSEDRGWYWGREATDERRNLNPLRKIQLFGSRHNLRGQEAAALAQQRQHLERIKEIARTEAVRHFLKEAHTALDQLVRDEKQLQNEIAPWITDLRGVEKIARGKIDEGIAQKLLNFPGLDRMSYLEAQQVGKTVGSKVVHDLLPLEDVGRWRSLVMADRRTSGRRPHPAEPRPLARLHPQTTHTGSPTFFDIATPARQRSLSPSSPRQSRQSSRSPSSSRQRSRSPSSSSSSRQSSSFARLFEEDTPWEGLPPTVSRADDDARRPNVLGTGPLALAGRGKGRSGRGKAASSSTRLELPIR